ncbi:hypothetical protein RUM44_008404 [Polyplax serrata]|uniref:GIT Spa2 homology (SHD) domain-containing protein n=1 Tax=Polyplax serrata TaxID=468196 RepID=A0ABR1BA89_POLSC
MVETLNKAGANNIWEHTLMEHGSTTVSCKPSFSGSAHSSKESFIKAKHEDLEFILQTDQETDGIEGVGAQLHAAARTPDVLTSLRLFSQGADPNFYHHDKKNMPLHVAAKSGQTLQAELFIVYGADITKKDGSGKTPEECALEAGHFHLANRLKEAKYHVPDRLSQYLYSRKPGSDSQCNLVKNDLTNLNYCQNNEAKAKLEMLSNSQLERLIEDVYDEVDRREAENASLINYSKGQTHCKINSTPFLPIHPALSTSRNQGRQKLGRLTDKEFNAMIIDILQEVKRRDTANNFSPLNKLKPEISDEEPLYDSVASDDDYAYTDKISPEREPLVSNGAQSSDKASEDDLRRNLSSSQATINRLQSEIKLLQDTVAGLVKENRELKDEILRARSYSRGIEASGEGEAEPVSDTKGQKSTRPTSMYETREALRYWSGKSDESRNGTQSLYQRQLYTQGTPRYEDVIRRTEQVAKRIKELWTAVQAGDFTTFVPCAERIRVAVAELTAIFPQSPPDELIRKLGANTARLQIECGTLPNCEGSVASHCLQQIRNCAYELAKATKLIVMNAQNG